MALENNLGVQADGWVRRSGPMASPRREPPTRSTLTSSTTTQQCDAPPTDFLTQQATPCHERQLQDQRGHQQLVPWGGGRYTLGLDAVAGDDEQPDQPVQPAARFEPCGASYTQPLLRNFKIDAYRQNVRQPEEQEIADLQLQQTLTQTSRIVRNAYFDLVNAIGQLQVAQQSLELAQTSLRNNQKQVEVGTIAPIDIVAGRSRSRANRGAGDRRRRPDSDPPRTRCGRSS